MTIKEEYFEWLYQVIEGKKYSKLLEMLYDTNFFSIVHFDENRISDGFALRRRFADEAGIPFSVMHRKIDSDYCSVLEVMVALALRIEESIMGDDDYGNRTSMWFWMMIRSLGLYDMTNDSIDREYVTHTIARFLNRDYEPNGKGGLFTVKNNRKDMRDVEIWYQMCAFFDDLL